VTRAVPLWTGGQYSAYIESGSDVRLSTPGWNHILITSDPGERVTCGQSYIGRDPGEINLNINRCVRAAPSRSPVWSSSTR
jgi:hypothetical protein